MIGARVVKTSVAVALAICLARSMDLQQAQFAGIVAVLSVQPTLYRSLRYGLQHLASAFLGALFGAVSLYAWGNSFLVIGLVVLAMMALHVKIKWTQSLLISVVITVNTMGAISEFFGASAMNQLMLVLIGTLSGTLVNLVHKPVHQERVEDLLVCSEGMLRALLFYLYLDLQEYRVTPYADMRKQIDEVKGYIERGKEISALIQEDRKFHRAPLQNSSAVFQAMESMIERIHDVSKELQKVDPFEEESFYCQRALLLTIRAQESKLHKRREHSRLLADAFHHHEQEIMRDPSRSALGQLPYVNVYRQLHEYLELLKQLDAWVEEKRVLVSPVLIKRPLI